MLYRAAVWIAILCTFSVDVEAESNHTIPEVTIQALWPIGLRVFIFGKINFSII